MSISLPLAVLWDMDGTLIDQTEPIIRCYREVITSLGYPEPSDYEIRRSMGGPMAATMSLFVEENTMEDACLTFRKRFPTLMFDGLIILPGALELIEYFSGNAIPQAIFTNKHGQTARAVSDHCGFSKHIPVCIGNTDTAWTKPDPELTRHVLGEIDAPAKGAVLIGDSPTDAAAALNVGIDFYGVSTGAHSLDELKAAGAKSAYSTLSDLLIDLKS